MEDPLPDGPWDLVISVLSIGGISDEQLQTLFRRVRDQSRSLVVGDQLEGDDLERALEWSEGELAWQGDGLAVIRAAYD
jgi:hypothetical protein